MLYPTYKSNIFVSVLIFFFLFSLMQSLPSRAGQIQANQISPAQINAVKGPDNTQGLSAAEADVSAFLVNTSSKTSTKTSTKTPEETPEGRNKISMLTLRTLDYMSSVMSALGPGQCLPGINCWKTSMTRFHAFEQQVNASDFDADKKKHAITCAKISSIVKGITGSSAAGYFAAMSIGLVKEVYDKSFLNPKGGRDYADLDADAFGAKIVYSDSVYNLSGKTHEDAAKEDIQARDFAYAARLQKRLDSLLERYYELLGSAGPAMDGKAGNTEKARQLYDTEIVPLQNEINKYKK
jgi:hypothetical protein